jgi:glycosyltransferase involved in cell wall biosynthesis
MLPVLNKGRNLFGALGSVRWASEVIVVESGWSDDTAAIAVSRGARVVECEYSPGGPKKKA